MEAPEWGTLLLEVTHVTHAGAKSTPGASIVSSSALKCAQVPRFPDDLSFSNILSRDPHTMSYSIFFFDNVLQPRQLSIPI